MKDRETVPERIRREGLDALFQRLGPVDTIRFLRHFGYQGSGDYTADRYNIIGNQTLDEIMSEIKAQRRRTKSKRAKAR
jgi:hypothetical protein